MRLQKIKAESLVESLGNKTLYVGSQAEAASKRKELVEQGYKRAEITTTEVDIPTDKAGLLKYLNGG